jgi:hypothetical protein
MYEILLLVVFAFFVLVGGKHLDKQAERKERNNEQRASGDER